MSALDSIIEGVREDLAARRQPLAKILEDVERSTPALDALKVLMAEPLTVIAEVKRSSPSKGSLAQIPDPAALALAYQDAGANVISVLTERRRFAGSLDDLDAVRARVEIPVLRKDFMVDEYMFYEARAHGADLILLIVAGLSRNQLKDYFDLTSSLGMHALVEVHTLDELEDALEINPAIIGVNARNLKTLEVNARAFAEILPRIPDSIHRVAESGITSREDVEFAQRYGAQSILVGEALVRASDPKNALRALKVG